MNKTIDFIVKIRVDGKTYYMCFSEWLALKNFRNRKENNFGKHKVELCGSFIPTTLVNSK